MPSTTATVSDLVADVIAENCDVIFGLMGNGNAHVVSNLTRRGLRYVAARHEAGTVAAADGYHRASGKIGVATVTYGAGFTNTMTALAEARQARVPLVLVVGDAPSAGPRLWDIDQTLAAQALGVQTITVTRAEASSRAQRAFATAQRERVPVVLAIPYDLAAVAAGPQDARLSFEAVVTPVTGPGEEAAAHRVATALVNARRPLIVGGRGAFLAGAGSDLRTLGDHVGALFATSVMARNLFESPWDLGIAGGFARDTNVALMRSADVVLLVGLSLNMFQMRYGTLLESAHTVIQVDEGPAASHDQVTDFVRADAADFSRRVLHAVETLQSQASSEPRLDLVPTWRQSLPGALAEGLPENMVVEIPNEHAVFGEDGRLDPRPIARELNAILPRNRSIVQDGGHFIGWMPMYCDVPDPQALILVGTAFQTIGLGFPAAVGVAAARPDRTTVVVAGDGGSLMALPDMESFVRTVTSGIIVVFNDAAYGAELHQYGVRGLDTHAMIIEEVDFAAVGRALGAGGVKVRVPADLQALRAWVEEGATGVFVVDIAVSQNIVADFMAESVALSVASESRI
jgi:acetolactate synthase-1/2/3 large subunit